MIEIRDFIEKGLSYEQYLKLIDDLLANGRTTGTDQSEAMVHYGRLNRQRMRRLDKTVELDTHVISAAKELRRPMIWLVITEGWCGDAAQNIPVIEKIAQQSELIRTRYVLRDEDLTLIDAFLTGGARAIPKLIAVEPHSLDVIGTWGSRPAAAQTLLEGLKASGADKLQISEQLQRWYNSDGTRSLQTEFADLIREWNEGRTRASAG